jgi:hypothetical protein
LRHEAIADSFFHCPDPRFETPAPERRHPHMKRINYNRLAAATVAAVALTMCATLAHAGDGRTCPGSTPFPNSAVVKTRLFNDCPTSAITVVNSYPVAISILDDSLDCFGFANRHAWSFSTDGTTDVAFENCSQYRWCADVTLSGTGGGEGGLRMSPWFSPDVDGVFMINASSGEIACFGGRVPFYSFTASQGLHYLKGTTVHMEIIYRPNALTAVFPASLQYNIVIGSSSYTSGPLAFNEGNPSEDPPHGLWGSLYPAFAGGYMQAYVGNGTPVNFVETWANICFDSDPITPVRGSTWGQLKTLYR